MIEKEDIDLGVPAEDSGRAATGSLRSVGEAPDQAAPHPSRARAQGLRIRHYRNAITARWNNKRIHLIRDDVDGGFDLVIQRIYQEGEVAQASCWMDRTRGTVQVSLSSEALKALFELLIVQNSTPIPPPTPEALTEAAEVRLHRKLRAAQDMRRVSAAKPLGSGVIAEPSEQRGAKHSDPNGSEGDAQKQEP